METVPVIVADGMTPTQVRTFRLLVNRSATWAEWDDEALRTEMAELRLELAAMPRSGRARRELSERIARLEEMAGETLYTAGYLAHYYDPDSRAPCADCVPARGVLY